ncbi:hypothetical protein STEG23_018281 [Scotinomys teguina]
MRLICSFCRANGVQRELSIVSLARIKERWILETRGISHSTPFQKVIRTVPPLTSNTLYSPENMTCSACRANGLQRELSIVSFARTKER